jgi:predicted DNA-binding protein (MmcQ/YjbR family)
MAPSTLSPERLARLRALCLAYPEASEKIAWGDPTWRVKDRIFAMQKGNYDGGRPSLWLKGAEGAQQTLVAARPASFFVPPYVGSKGWIGIYLDGARLEWDVIGDLVLESYRLVAGPRLAARLDSEPSPTAGRERTKRTPTKRTPTKRTPTKRTPTKRTPTKRTPTKRTNPKRRALAKAPKPQRKPPGSAKRGA